MITKNDLVGKYGIKEELIIEVSCPHVFWSDSENRVVEKHETVSAVAESVMKSLEIFSVRDGLITTDFIERVNNSKAFLFLPSRNAYVVNDTQLVEEICCCIVD